MRWTTVALFLATAMLGCAPRVRAPATPASSVPPLDRSQVPEATADAQQNEEAGAEGQRKVVISAKGAGGPKSVVITQPSPASPGSKGTVVRADTVSASAGQVGGLVVLWPRVVPRSDDEAVRALADALQGRLSRLSSRALPHRQVELRPEPERSCPQGGCLGVSVGVVLAHRDGACAAVIYVAQPGESPANLIAWGGKVELKQAQAPFREPPESYFTVKDFARCDTLLQELDGAVAEQTIRTVGQ